MSDRTSKPVCPACGRHQYVSAIRHLRNGDKIWSCLDRPWMGFKGCGHKWVEEKQRGSTFHDNPPDRS